MYAVDSVYQPGLQYCHLADDDLITMEANHWIEKAYTIPALWSPKFTQPQLFYLEWGGGC